MKKKDVEMALFFKKKEKEKRVIYIRVVNQI